MMATDRFTATVQYGDWKGASAADNADQNDASDWLEANGHKKPGGCHHATPLIAYYWLRANHQSRVH